MKKIIAVIALSLAFGYNANAQDNSKTASASTENSASKETNLKKSALTVMNELKVAIGNLDESLQRDLTTLLMMRMDAVANATTDEEKKSLFNRFTNKFLGGLSPEQLENLKKNKELYTSLTEYK